MSVSDALLYRRFYDHVDDTLTGFKKDNVTFAAFRIIEYINESDKLSGEPEFSGEIPVRLKNYMIEYANTTRILFKASPLYKFKIVTWFTEILFRALVKLGFGKLRVTLNNIRQASHFRMTY